MVTLSTSCRPCTTSGRSRQFGGCFVLRPGRRGAARPLRAQRRRDHLRPPAPAWCWPHPTGTALADSRAADLDLARDRASTDGDAGPRTTAGRASGSCRVSSGDELAIDGLPPGAVAEQPGRNRDESRGSSAVILASCCASRSPSRCATSTVTDGPGAGRRDRAIGLRPDPAAGRASAETLGSIREAEGIPRDATTVASTASWCR